MFCEFKNWWISPKNYLNSKKKLSFFFWLRKWQIGWEKITSQNGFFFGMKFHIPLGMLTTDAKTKKIEKKKVFLIIFDFCIILVRKFLSNLRFQFFPIYFSEKLTKLVGKKTLVKCSFCIILVRKIMFTTFYLLSRYQCLFFCDFFFFFFCFFFFFFKFFYQKK